VLFAIDLHEDFSDVESITVAPVLSVQSATINGSELDTPQADCLSADSDAPFGQEIFDVSVAQVETIVKPDSVRNDIGWESVAFISIHPPILSISAL
jgi:hypothetical protein